MIIYYQEYDNEHFANLVTGPLANVLCISSHLFITRMQDQKQCSSYNKHWTNSSYQQTWVKLNGKRINVYDGRRT